MTEKNNGIYYFMLLEEKSVDSVKGLGWVKFYFTKVSNWMRRSWKKKLVTETWSVKRLTNPTFIDILCKVDLQ